MPDDQAHDHNNNGDEKNENGDAVHAVHEGCIDVTRRIRVFFFQEKILLNLVPDAGLHNDPLIRLKINNPVGEMVGTPLYLQPDCGGLAQLVERLHGMQEVSGSNPLSSTPIPARLSAIESRFYFWGTGIASVFNAA